MTNERTMMDKIKERATRERRQGMKLVENTKMLSDMNQKQVNVMKQILLDIPRFDFHNSDDFEVKELQMKMTPFNEVYVVLVTGMIGDEGTLASTLGRKRRTFWIGNRGGLRRMNSKYNTTSVSRFDLMNSYYEH